jgi:hypothetical protein
MERKRLFGANRKKGNMPIKENDGKTLIVFDDATILWGFLMMCSQGDIAAKLKEMRIDEDDATHVLDAGIRGVRSWVEAAYTAFKAAEKAQAAGAPDPKGKA